jgi:hypothetical protein
MKTQLKSWFWQEYSLKKMRVSGFFESGDRLLGFFRNLIGQV